MSVPASSAKKIAVGSVQAIHAMLSMAQLLLLGAAKRSLFPLAAALSRLMQVDTDTGASASSWPGSSRPSTSWQIEKKGVDARVKPGHDECVVWGEVKREMRLDFNIATPVRARNRARYSCGRTRSR